MNDIIARNIKYYRETLGLNKKELAQKIACNTSLITRYENGERIPTLKTLLSLSEVFKVSLDEFISDEPKQIQMAARATGKLTREEKEERMFFQKLAEHYIKLLNDIGIKTEYQGSIYPSFSLNHIPELKQILELSDVIDYEILQTALSSRLNIQIFELPFKQKNISGLTFRLDNTFIIFINKGHNEQRRLFSLAHEFCHILFHINENTFLISRLSSRSNVEKEANKFAQKFLIPENRFDNEFQDNKLHSLKKEYIRQLAQKFNVSPECMFRNLYDKGLVKYNWSSYKSQTAYETNYSTQWSYKDLPYLYVIAVYLNWKKELISTAKAAEYIFTDLRETSDILKEIDKIFMGEA